MTRSLSLAVLVLLPAVLPAHAQTNQCRFYLMDQYDLGPNLGVSIDLETPSDAGPTCQLTSVSLALSIGDGKSSNFVVSKPDWLLGHEYTVKAVLTTAGPQQLFLDGQLLGTSQASFQPLQRTLFGSEIPNWANGTAAYQVTQSALTIENGKNKLTLPAGGNDLPLPLILLAGGPTFWPGTFTVDPSQPTTITSTFRIDAAVSNPHKFDPYIDRYGQSAYGDWPTKVKSDSDLAAATAEEQTWLSNNAAVGGLDPFGGSTLAGWHDQASGFYRTAFHNNRWWLISPKGNPLFYISLSNVPQQSEATPITGRESMFAELPPKTGQFGNAWLENVWGDTPNTTYISFHLANQVRKYGDGWLTKETTLAVQRLASWGFAGMGKWSSITPGIPVTPVLFHFATPNVVPAGHPDIFDPAVVAKLKADLTGQIGSNAANPYIVGWSVGNEIAEIIMPSETQAMLALGASVPAKRALVDHAIASLYGGSLSALASSWKITAATKADAYAAKPSAPAADIEALRQFFEQNYFHTVYQTVKTIAPHHLYLGMWIVPDYWVNSHDWEINAPNCDVIGFDYYVPKFLSKELDSLIRASNKPVILGEYSFPPAYEGLRGFGSSLYVQNTTPSDAASGDVYTQWLHDTSAYPFLVGVSWFEYRDEPVSGRGDASGKNIGTNLVYGEDYAFGMVDVADQPKYDLVNKVRAANVAALEQLGLQRAPAAPVAAAVVNAASFVSGGLVPGGIATLFGSKLTSSSGINLTSSLPLPGEFLNSAVLAGGFPSALFAVDNVNGQQQINFQVPWELAGQPSAILQVVNSGASSAPIAVPVIAAQPGIFNYSVGSSVFGAILHASFQLADSGHPAAAGETVLIYCTGLGAVSAPPPDGAAGSGQLTLAKAAVSIGGAKATVAFSGLAPGFVGLYQVNAVVPPGLGTGNKAVVITINGASSNSVLLPIR